MIRTPKRRQAGITAIGLLILVGVFGILGLGTLKITPLYLQNMRLGTILDDVKTELDGTGATPTSIRLSINKRLGIEGMRISPEDIKITQGRNGYNVQVQFENRTSFLADVWFLVVFDKQIEIRR